MKSAISKIEKIVINVGIGRVSALPNFDKTLPEIVKELSLITGQKPSPRPARQSIATFKLRAGAIIGLKTTLRRNKMRDFLDRLTKTALPRIRDFRGIDLSSIDKQGNLTTGIKEHIVFPEIIGDQSKVNFGLSITIVPKIVKNREEAIKLYRELGIPLKKS